MGEIHNWSDFSALVHSEDLVHSEVLERGPVKGAGHIPKLDEGGELVGEADGRLVLVHALRILRKQGFADGVGHNSG